MYNVPEKTDAPPLDEVYQYIVDEAVADNATEPLPQRLLLVGEGADGVTAIVTDLDIELRAGYTLLLLLVKAAMLKVPPPLVLRVVESVTVSDPALKV